ncbi:MAG: outer membrane protein assembly factor BamA, partial [Candidatus Omnitrophota bacterium]
RVIIEGNENFSYTRIIRLMKTRPAWLLNRGVFQDDVLRDDAERIRDFYKNEGFSDAVVETDVDETVKGIHVTVTIKEGQRYYVGRIKIEGNKEIALYEIKKALELSEGDVFSTRAMYEDSSRIKGVYVDKGYIFATIDPVSVFDLDTEKIHISYKIVENEIAYIERVNIRGNVKTKDKVIRRELKVYPGEIFDGERIRKSKEKLGNLGFFEEIIIDTEPGSKPDWVDLVIDVKEAKTGYASFGGGYSSIDEFIGFVELRQRNFDYKNFSTFTGGGQDLSLHASFGTLTDRYQLSFTNPWIFDTPIAFGFDGYKKGHKREEDVGYAYEEDIRGGVLRLSREFGEHIKTGAAYRFERVEITDVIPEATQEFKDEEGANDLSSGELSFTFDTRDNVFVPSK